MHSTRPRRCSASIVVGSRHGTRVWLEPQHRFRTQNRRPATGARTATTKSSCQSKPARESVSESHLMYPAKPMLHRGAIMPYDFPRQNMATGWKQAAQIRAPMTTLAHKEKYSVKEDGARLLGILTPREALRQQSVERLHLVATKLACSRGARRSTAHNLGRLRAH